MAVWQQDELARHLAALGVGPGDAVMVHAALRSIGPMAERGRTLAGAILNAIGPQGTLIAYTDWDGLDTHCCDESGRVAGPLKSGIIPFDPATSPATPDNGAIAEIVRTWPGALRSGNPGASVAAIGRRAAWFTADHPIDYGYGEGSPLAKLVELGGKVLMVGAPLDTMTLLHHAEHLAVIPGKRIWRYEVPFSVDGRAEWRMVEEFNTSIPVVAGLEDDYFTGIVRAFLDRGAGCQGTVGAARSVLVPAREIVAFAVDWLEVRFAVRAGE
jgi:aminoglycoside 3-N-acetyltransferase